MPVVISPIQTMFVASHGATLVFTTDVPALVTVEYGSTISLGFSISETYASRQHRIGISLPEASGSIYYSVSAVAADPPTVLVNLAGQRLVNRSGLEMTL